MAVKDLADTDQAKRTNISQKQLKDQSLNSRQQNRDNSKQK
jgi:hypothetical protein